jgi:alpha-mannosidase
MSERCLGRGDAYDPAAAMRFALEHQNPLVGAPVTSDPSGPDAAYPGNSFSLMELSNPNVLLWALKPAEEGIKKGVVARIWNLSDQAAECRVDLRGGLREAWQVTHIETNLRKMVLQDNDLSIELLPQQLQTYRLFPELFRPNTGDGIHCDGQAIEADCRSSSHRP